MATAPVSGSGMIPENAELIYNLLTAAGLNANAAAGILGNIYQESGGNPQAGSYPGSYGLIQWTPAQQSNYTVPNNSSVTTQVGYIIKYIEDNGSIAAINAAATSPSAAALYFSEYYERPLAAAADNTTREQSAGQVAAAAASGNWSTGSASNSNPQGSDNPAGGFTLTSDSSSGAPSWVAGVPGLSWIVGTATGLSDIATALKDMANMFALLFKPSLYFRIGAFFAGIVFLSFGIYMLAKVVDSDIHLPSAPSVVPIPV